MSYYSVRPEANFGPLIVPNLPDAPVNYSDLLPSRPHDRLAETKLDIAYNIDQKLDGMTVATIFSIRRLYKIYGTMPTSHAIYREMGQIYGDDSVTLENIETSLIHRDEIITQLLPIAYQWVSWCYHNRDGLRLNLTNADITEIAEDTVIKIVNLRYLFDQPDSNGVGLIKLVNASIKPMIIFTNYHSDGDDISISDFSGFTDIDNEQVLDLLSFWSQSQNQGANPEDIFCDRENHEYCNTELDEPSLRLSDVSIETNNYSSLQLFQQLMLEGQIPLETLFATISTLPLIYQSSLLHYFGYVEPLLNLDQFIHAYPPISSDIRSKGLMRLTSLLQNTPNNDSSYNLNIMIDRGTNIPLLTQSLQLERSKYSSLFTLLNNLQSISPEQLANLGSNEQWLLDMVMGNITYDSSGTPSRKLGQIAHALSEQWSGPVTTIDVERFISNVLIPAIHGDNFDIYWSERFTKILEQRQVPKNSSDADCLSSITDDQIMRLLNPNQRIAYELICREKLSLKEAGIRLGITYQAVQNRLTAANNRVYQDMLQHQ